jgi:cell wall-associated NlpC family hydrolase
VAARRALVEDEFDLVLPSAPRRAISEPYAPRYAPIERPAASVERPVVPVAFAAPKTTRRRNTRRPLALVASAMVAGTLALSVGMQTGGMAAASGNTTRDTNALSRDLSRTALTSQTVNLDQLPDSITTAMRQQAAIELAADQATADQQTQAQAEAQFAADQAAAKAAAEKAAAEKAAAEKAAAEKAAAEKAAAEKAAAQRAAQLAAWTASPAPIQAGSATGAAATALNFAMAQVGKPYVYGAAGPDSYDCSGLTYAAYRSAGITLPRTAAGQAGVGVAVSVSNLQPGDLVVYNGGGHVAMYIGNGQVVHAADYGIGVVVSSLYSPGSIYATRHIG